MQTITSTITLNNKKYTYSLTKKNKDIVHVICNAAKISQDFLAEDVAALLIDLPNLIISENKYQEKHSTVVRFRVSAIDKNKIEKKAVQSGFDSVSDYLRHLALN